MQNLPTTPLHKTAITTTLFCALLSIHAHANAKKILTVYTYDSFTAEWGAGPKLKKMFEKKCACTVKFVSFDKSVTIFNRVRLEGKRTKADVLLGLDNNLIKSAKASGLFANNNIDISKLQLPKKWDNKAFIPYDYGQFAFIYDKNKLKNPPKSLKELIENDKLSVIYQDPRTSTVGRGLLSWVNTVYGTDSEKAWSTLAKHTVTVGKGWSETYGAFLKGESDMVLSYHTSPLYHQINENKENYVAAEFSEGHIVQIEVAARLKSSASPKLSEDFLKFLITPEAQKQIAVHNFMLPVIETVVEPRFDTFKPAKTLSISYSDRKTIKKQIRVWQKAVSK